MCLQIKDDIPVYRDILIPKPCINFLILPNSAACLLATRSTDTRSTALEISHNKGDHFGFM